MTSCCLAKKAEINKRTINNENDYAIVFLVFKINKDTVQGKNVIELLSKTKTTGKIKEIAQTNVNTENYLTLDVYETGKLTNSIVLPHPLYKNIEYSEGNTLKSKFIESEKEEFFIRLQIKESSTKIRVSESLKSVEKKELTTIQL